jgi:hypothetical protein
MQNYVPHAKENSEPKIEAVRVSWREVHNKELHKLSSPNIFLG